MKRVIVKVTGLALIALVSLQSFKRFHHSARSPEKSLFVTLCDDRIYGYHRTGNHLFMLSALLDLATKTGREIIMPEDSWLLDQVFDFNKYSSIPDEEDIIIKRYKNRNETCPCEILNFPHFTYDARFSQVAFLDKYSRKSSPDSVTTLEICGLCQTYVHSINPDVEKKLRKLLFKLRNDAYYKTDLILKRLKYLMQKDSLKSFTLYSYKDIHSGFTKNVSLYDYNYDYGQPSGKDIPFLVGVHLRIGDFKRKANVDYGLTVADGHYFQKAFEYFIHLHKTVIFVVISDDINWVTKHFQEFVGLTNSTSNKDAISYNQKNVKIIFFRDTMVQDFALLCRSDGLIISTGTFGWWAGWFNKDASVIYYDNYPKPNSTLARLLNKKTYFMKNWIPMI